MRLERAERRLLEAGELRCPCAVSVELLRVLSEDPIDTRKLRRSWDRYLAWHPLEPGGSLAGIAERAGLPSERWTPTPGTQI